MPTAAAVRREDAIEISPTVQKEALRHPDKWVAITPDRFIAAAVSIEEVFRLARKAGVTSPIVYRVPPGGATYFF